MKSPPLVVSGGRGLVPLGKLANLLCQRQRFTQSGLKRLNLFRKLLDSLARFSELSLELSVLFFESLFGRIRVGDLNHLQLVRVVGLPARDEHFTSLERLIQARQIDLCLGIDLPPVRLV